MFDVQIRRVASLRSTAEYGAFDGAEAVLWVAAPHDFSAPGVVEECLALLSTEERSRHARFKFAPDRQAYMVAHVLLRIALSQHQGVERSAWRFNVRPGGRPEISAPVSRLRFSLSHTNGLVVCAVATGSDIGADVEDTQRPCALDVAERFFAPAEVQALHSLPLSARPARFFEYWTLKEAYVKARGCGLMLPLDQFSFHRDRDGEWEIAFTRAIADNESHWRFWSARLRGRHQLALAIRDRERPPA